MIDIVCILYGLAMLYKMDTMVLYSTASVRCESHLTIFESAALSGRSARSG